MKKSLIHILQTHIVLLAGFTTVFLAACSSEDESVNVRIAGEKETVRVLVPNPVTRTYIDDDEGGSEAGQTMSVQWSDGDRFVLTATDDEGETYSQITFTHTERTDGWSGYIFTAEMQLLPKEKTYTYRAVYPVPETPIDNNRAYYTIPSVQNGEYDGSVKDLMWATTAGGQSHLKPQIYNPLDFRFKHLLHALKITIPANPFGESQPIESVYISFPQAVTGRLSVDMTTGTAALEEDGTQGYGVTVQFDEPKAEGEAFWVFLAPSDAVNGEVQFMATDGTDYTWPVSTAAFRNLSAGYITPVRLGGLAIRPQSEYRVRVTDYSQLGEQIIDITSMTLPEGYVFPGPNMTRTAEHLTYTGDEGTFSVPMYDDIIEKLTYNRPTVDFVLESNHAENLTTVATDMTAKECTLVAPYLFFEDFSEVESFSSNDSYGTSSTGNKDAYSFLNGWTGGRCGALEKTSIRIAARRETSARYGARVDSAPINKIKNNTTVNVSVVFDYGANRQEGGIGTAKVGQTVYMGYVTDPTAYKSGETTGTYNTSFNINELDGTWTNLPHEGVFTIESCYNQTRLSWRSETDSNAGLNNSTCWLYLDNIRVTIVP